MTGKSAVAGSITLPGVTRSVACARRFTRDVLGPGHPSLHDVQTCVSEGFTNAVLRFPGLSAPQAARARVHEP